MPVGGPAFSSVRKAREALKERAHELLNLYIRGMEKALDAADFETFQKGMSDIVKHIPKDEDGTTVFDTDVDKQKAIERPSGPAIQIGVAIGGLGQLTAGAPGAKPSLTVIDVTATEALPEPDPTPSS